MQTISGAELKRMILSAAASIEIHKQDLNELNVFPVPDGDTGTNMSMTIGAARGELEALPDTCTVAEASKTAASAMLRGAWMAPSCTPSPRPPRPPHCGAPGATPA